VDLIDVLSSRAARTPDRPAITYLGEGEAGEVSLSYAELDARARAIAALLLPRARPGQTALLLFPPGLDFVAALLGCFYAGVVAVPVYPPDLARPTRSLPRFRSLMADARADVVLTTPALAALSAALPPEWLEAARPETWLACDAHAHAPDAAWRRPALPAGALALLQYTSGSTAEPKGVMLSHDNLIANQEMIRGAFGLTERSIALGWLPLYHDMGLIGLVMQPLFVGCPRSDT